MVAALKQDLLLAVRQARRTPAVSLIAVLTLALGIGTTSAMFGVLQAVLLAPLPWGHPDRGVMVWSRWSAFDKTWVADGEVLDYRRRSRTLEQVAAWADGQVNVTGGVEPERVGRAQVTANLFDALRVRPILGRPILADEDVPGGPRVAVISYEIWQRRYGGRSEVLGRGIELNGEGYRIVGVMPRGFALPTDYAGAERTEVLTPLQIDPGTADHGSHGLYAAARMREGVTIEQVNADLQAITTAMTGEGLYPRAMQFGAFAVTLREEVVGSSRPAVVATFGAVVFILLIACANVANLMLVRAESRQREMAVRTALGASRGRLFRQLLVEGLALSFVAAGAGLILSFLVVWAIASWNPAGIPRLEAAQVDLPVALFTVAIAVIVAVLFSLAPAARVLGADLTEHLKEGSQNATVGAARQRLRGTLIVVETALAIVLVVGAGLMVRSLAQLQRIDLGFDPANVLTFRVSVPESAYRSPESAVTFYRSLLVRLRALPGVAAAAAVRSLPLAAPIGDFGLVIEGYVPPPGHHAKGDWQIVTDGYLEAMRERLIRGRGIRASDDEQGMLVAMINQQMAAKYWPGRDPIGARFRIGSRPERPWVTVVGIVHDVRHNGVTDVAKEKFYIPHAQWHRSVGPMRTMFLVVRGSDDVRHLTASIRAEVQALDPRIPVASVRTMEEVVDAALSSPRFTSALFATFSFLAVLLAAVGIYGVLSSVVAQRTREIGIRMAVGASPAAVTRAVMGRGLLLAGTGLVIGMLLSVTLARGVRVLLYQTAPTDPISYVAGIAVLLAVVTAASYIPARRATSVDPVVALKAE